ncbi:hypothetical protein AB1K70_14045 [Bremerella sp. JC770]|uniref:leucine-rich repeat domain-containing protein n=1 Tax=Bremerella sp. JC770 TaxID=3232137 RepID=UPI0034578E8C
MKCAVVGLLVGAFFCGLVGRAGAQEKVYRPIDLQPYANQKLSQDFHGYPGNNLKPLPRGPQIMADAPLLIGDSFLQLASKRAPDFPEKIEGIEVGTRGDKLHILHGTGWGSPGVADGTPIGAYVVHYKDGTEETIPIHYGRDVRDWWALGDKDPATKAKTAWTGLNDASRDFRGMEVDLRLFLLTWENPFADKEIASLTFISHNDTISAPFLIAVSAETTIDENAIRKKLEKFGAFIETSNDERITKVSLSGPGLIQGVTRGTDEVVCLAADLPHLEILYLNSSSVTDDGLSCLTRASKLRWLSLNLTGVTDAGLAHLKSISGLERLRLYRTRITDDGLKHLTGLSQLEVLDLSETDITDQGLEHLSSLARLKKLDLRGTKVSDAGAAKLQEKLSPELEIVR